MDSEKERIAKWRKDRQRRQRMEREDAQKRSFSSHFTLDDGDAKHQQEFEQYLVRQNLTKAHRTRRMTTGEVNLALSTWDLDELNQLWSMREDKLTYLDDAASLLSHIRFRAGIDSELRPAHQLLGYEAIEALQGKLEESGRLAAAAAPPAEEETLEEGKRVEQVRRVIREGQATFRKQLIAHYGAICMVTGTAQASVIDAAHIVAYNGASTNALSNGLLLRKDVHALFDAGLLRLTEDCRVTIDASVHDPYYRSLDGRSLHFAVATRVSKDALRRRLAGKGFQDLA